MTSILFERTPHAYLPEIDAYKAFLDKHYPDIRYFDFLPSNLFDPGKYDVVWRFMGLDISGKGQYIVHEYNSLSTGRFAKLKNTIKKTCNRKPDRRIFLNETVQAEFALNDHVPYALRDMGINDAFFVPSTEKLYDFVYAGSLNRGRIIYDILDQFRDRLKDQTIALIGYADDRTRARYEGYENIIFFGRKAYVEIPSIVAQARYGLNLMPDIYPYNLQTATKVLEYCALRLPVITTDYKWIREFEATRQGAFYYIGRDKPVLDMEKLERFSFSIPGVQDLRWETVIQQSGIFDFLKTL